MHPAPSPRANAMPPGMPFTIGRPLRANEPIFGRDGAFRFIDSALASFSSVNIVGERRMGKTSLLAHLRDNPAYAPAAPAGQPPLALAFLDLQDDITSAARFYGRAIDAWLARLPAGGSGAARQLAEIKRRLAARPELDNAGFDRALALFASPQGASVRPVLVLDEVERLLELAEQGQLPYPDFFNHLRARMTAGHLAIIAASRRPLSDYFSDPRRPGSLTSTFPTYLQPFVLRELDGAAADSLLLQPSAHPLTLAEASEARRWANDHPCRLQVAGAAVYEAKRDGRDAAWARARREELARQACMIAPPAVTGSPVPRTQATPIGRALSAIFWAAPLRIGRLAQKIGAQFSDMAAWLIGVAVLVVVVLIAFGFAGGADVLKLVLKALGLGG